SADYRAFNIRVQNGNYVFNVESDAVEIKDIILPMGGRHNVENCTAAIAVALELGIEKNIIKDVVKDFKGVQRRFEFGIRNDHFVYIDDYAHHPEELRALIGGVKELYPISEIIVIFQPHLFTRTKDHVDSFAEVLDEANEIIILPIYPARELPIEGVNSEMIQTRMKNTKVSIKSKDDILKWMEQSKSYLERKVIVTAGAGDIDQLVEPIKKLLGSYGG
ncbi:MAG: glutamate ligase domain-containing protein, partial [Chitinophagaceae bacterium]